MPVFRKTRSKPRKGGKMSKPKFTRRKTQQRRKTRKTRKYRKGGAMITGPVDPSRTRKGYRSEIGEVLDKIQSRYNPETGYFSKNAKNTCFRGIASNMFKNVPVDEYSTLEDFQDCYGNGREVWTKDKLYSNDYLSRRCRYSNKLGAGVPRAVKYKTCSPLDLAEARELLERNQPLSPNLREKIVAYNKRVLGVAHHSRASQQGPWGTAMGSSQQSL